ncbi:MAG TPA: DUF6544 family protein [Gemmatimonadales bacterium]|nr:DUF6544 family protein [Gemmatimonadales bacterium]
MWAEDRGRVVGGRVVPTPWDGRWSGYRLRDGMTAPRCGEVAWVEPNGKQPSWRGTVTERNYEFGT